MPAPEVNLSQQSTGQPLPAGARRIKSNKGGRPTNRCKGGQTAWLKRLQRAGRTAEAAEWARRCNLHAEPEPAEAATPADAAASATGSPTAATPATTAPVPDGAGFAGHGGEGVDQAAGRENGDKTTVAGIILQCNATAAAAPAGPSLIRGLTGDSLPLIAASPSGEVEGKMGNCQSGSISEADGQGVMAEDSNMERGWPKVCEAWVGVRGRNKDWVDVQVTESLWAKAWVRDFNVQYGTRQAVTLKWVSADGRDAEYAFVAAQALPEPAEEPDPVIEPIGDADLVVEKTGQVIQQSDPDPVLESDQQAGPDENPSAGDFMERARMQAYADFR